MAKFKVGDRVKYVGKSRTYVSENHLGKCGKVTADSLNSLSVKFDDGTVQIGCYPDNLELIQTAAPSAVRVTTRREIVSGSYRLSDVGTIDIRSADCGYVHVTIDRYSLDSTALRQLSALVLEIADVLDENARAESHGSDAS